MCVCVHDRPSLPLLIPHCVLTGERGHRLVEDTGGEASGAEYQEGVAHLCQHVGRVGSGQRLAPTGWEAETKELF